MITGATTHLQQQTCQQNAAGSVGKSITFPYTDTVERKRQTPASNMLLHLCQQLFLQTGVEDAAMFGAQTGLVSGAYYGCMSITQGILTALRQKGPRGVDAIEFAKSTHSFPLSAASIEFALLGPAAAVVSGELASLEALIMARDWLLAGRCQRVIVVGYEYLSPLLHTHLPHIGGDADYSDNMSVALLETKASALSRGAPVLAELIRLRRFSGPLANMARQWGTAIQQIELGNEACRFLSASTLQADAVTLEQAVAENCKSSQLALRSEMQRFLGATTVMQLVASLNAPTACEWVLNSFAPGGGGMIHLRKETL